MSVKGLGGGACTERGPAVSRGGRGLHTRAGLVGKGGAGPVPGGRVRTGEQVSKVWEERGAQGTLEPRPLPHPQE